MHRGHRKQRRSGGRSTQPPRRNAKRWYPTYSRRNGESKVSKEDHPRTRRGKPSPETVPRQARILLPDQTDIMPEWWVPAYYRHRFIAELVGETARKRQRNEARSDLAVNAVCAPHMYFKHTYSIVTIEVTTFDSRRERSAYLRLSFPPPPATCLC